MTPLLIIFALELMNADHTRPARIVLKDGDLPALTYMVPPRSVVCAQIPRGVQIGAQLTILNDSDADMADVGYWTQPPDASFCTKWNDARRRHSRTVPGLRGTLAPPHEPITPSEPTP